MGIVYDKEWFESMRRVAEARGRNWYTPQPAPADRTLRAINLMENATRTISDMTEVRPGCWEEGPARG